MRSTLKLTREAQNGLNELAKVVRLTSMPSNDTSLLQMRRLQQELKEELQNAKQAQQKLSKMKEEAGENLESELLECQETDGVPKSLLEFGIAAVANRFGIRLTVASSSSLRIDYNLWDDCNIFILVNAELSEAGDRVWRLKETSIPSNLQQLSRLSHSLSETELVSHIVNTADVMFSSHSRRQILETLRETIVLRVAALGSHKSGVKSRFFISDSLNKPQGHIEFLFSNIYDTYPSGMVAFSDRTRQKMELKTNVSHLASSMPWSSASSCIAVLSSAIQECMSFLDASEGIAQKMVE